MGHGGKNSKFVYYAESYLSLCVPHFIQAQRLSLLKGRVSRRKDYAEIMERVGYYCKLVPGSFAESSCQARAGCSPAPDREKMIYLRDQKIKSPKVYVLDSFRYARFFPMSLKWCLCAGDVTHVPSIPSIVKSRPISGDNSNSVLMKLDKVRHFTFVRDKKDWKEKLDMVIFRGAIGQMEGNCYKKNRYDFLARYFNHPMCNLGEVPENGICVNNEWCKPKISIMEHLDYKFIMALEGNDVASNLKWIMSSHSIAVMPRPRYETWFMEGRLIPDYHYIEIRPDYSDLEDKLKWYIGHPEKAMEIIRHANEYVKQFRNSRRERIVSLLVLDKYFRCTGQQP